MQNLFMLYRYKMNPVKAIKAYIFSLLGTKQGMYILQTLSLGKMVCSIKEDVSDHITTTTI